MNKAYSSTGFCFECYCSCCYYRFNHNLTILIPNMPDSDLPNVKCAQGILSGMGLPLVSRISSKIHQLPPTLIHHNPPPSWILRLPIPRAYNESRETVCSLEHLRTCFAHQWYSQYLSSTTKPAYISLALYAHVINIQSFTNVSVWSSKQSTLYIWIL